MSTAQSDDGLGIVTLPSRVYGRDDLPVVYRRALPLTAARARYSGFRQESLVLRKGTVRRDGARPLECDIQFDRDVPVQLRDGTTIYTDVFRPVDRTDCPALVAWAPYGKQYGGVWLDDVPMRAGVPLEEVSELQRFEGPDPAYWVQHGYAVLHPDDRGTYHSEGNLRFWGRTTGEDGHDFVEWTAQQPWCSGKVGLTGNSWLAIAQWFIAAERPPHLAAFAPWEGLFDAYRDHSVRGGIPNPAFSDIIVQTFAGSGYVEDLPRMTLQQPLMNSYWQDKIARLDRIDVPAYVVASYTNPLHTTGTFRGFHGIASTQKWLRVHNTHEWSDYYQYSDDLRRFFDYFLKGDQNGWESTPRVRLSIVDPGGTDVVDRPELDFPPVGTTYRQLHLNPVTRTLDDTASKKIASAEYDPANENLEFATVFEEDTDIVGPMALHLWVEAKGADDMDLTVRVEKLSVTGEPIVMPDGPFGAGGVLRVSHRAVDKSRSRVGEPYLVHTTEDKLQPGEVVAVDIPIAPIGLRVHAGEQLRLTIGTGPPEPPEEFPLKFGSAKIKVPVNTFTFQPGDDVQTVELGGPPDPTGTARAAGLAPSVNRGTHVVHAGGECDSYLWLPVAPR